jgi:hypothetical protein
LTARSRRIISCTCTSFSAHNSMAKSLQIADCTAAQQQRSSSRLEATGCRALMAKQFVDVGHYSIEMKTVSCRSPRFRVQYSLFMRREGLLRNGRFQAWELAVFAAHDTSPGSCYRAIPLCHDESSGSGGLLLAWLKGKGSLVATLREEKNTKAVTIRRRSP